RPPMTVPLRPSAADKGCPARLWDTAGCVGAWRSLVARAVRVGEVPGSNQGGAGGLPSFGIWLWGHGFRGIRVDAVGQAGMAARKPTAHGPHTRRWMDRTRLRRFVAA